MRNSYLLLLLALFASTAISAQVKIGDNPQNIDPSSVLELESTDKVLVVTRVTTAQMNAITPLQGALCFNTDLQSVHYYDGTQWVNIGGSTGTGGPLTADPIVNTQSTIVITPTATGDNLEVAPNSIRSEQIVDGGINGVDIQDGSIGPGKIQDNSVTQEKLSENSVGAFALDNDNIGVSAFNNDVGYITAGDINIVSADVGNSLEIRTDGVFYNAEPLILAINQNIDAIALDNDQSSANEIQNLTLNGSEIGLTDTAGTIDIGPLISAGGSDDQNLELPTLSPTNILTLNIEGGDPTSVDLSSLANGAAADGSETIVTAGTNVTVAGNGTTATPYIINSTGGGGTADGSETIINTSPTVSVAGTGTTLDPYLLTSSGGADGSETIIDATASTVTVTGTGTTLNPYVLLSTAGDGSETVINTSPTVSVAGTGTTLDPYLLTSSGGADGSETIIDATNSTVTVTGTGTTLDPYVLLSTAGDGSETIIDATNSTVTVTGTGTTLDPYVLLSTAGDGSETVINTSPTVAVAGTGTALDPYLLTSSGGADGSETIIDATNSTVTVTGTGTTLDPYVLLSTAGDGSETIIDATNSTVTVTGTGTTLDPYVLTTTASDGSETIIDATNSTVTVTGTGTTLDPYVLTTTASDGSETIIDATNSTVAVTGTGTTLDPYVLNEHTGTANHIFFADETTGAPTVSDLDGLVWDPEGRIGGSGAGFGALYVGLDGGAHSTKVKVHIADNLNNQLTYPLQIQNRALATGSATGMIFSVDEFTTSYGKGALVYERDATGWARGDFHFLQRQVDGPTNPELTDKAFTIYNNGDVKLYAGLEASNGFGGAGQVLSSTGTGVQWVAPSGGTSVTDTDANDGLTDFNATTGYNVNVDDTSIEIVSDALQIKNEGVTLAKIQPVTPAPATNQMLITNTSGNVVWANAGAGGDNLATADLTQTTGQDRTYDLNGQNLIFTGTGNIGIGSSANPPENKFHVAGEIRSEGFNSTFGSAGAPAYSFAASGNPDSDTGMYRAAADQIGFSVGGFEALRIEEPSTGNTNVIVNQSLELDGTLLDKDGDAGTTGQVLSSTGGANPQTDWVTTSSISPIKAFGKISAAGVNLNVNGANVSQTGPSTYLVTLTTARPNANYIVQLTSFFNTQIFVLSQTTNTFEVQITDVAGVSSAQDWYFTVID